MLMSMNFHRWATLAPGLIIVFVLALFHGMPADLLPSQQSLFTRQVSTPPVTVSSVRVRSKIKDDANGIHNDVFHSTDTELDEDNRKVYYTHARHDRAGQHLLFFFNLDAAAYADGGIMGGHCIHYDPEILYYKEHLEDAKALIELLGFENDFLYACPTDEDIESGKAVELRWKEMQPPEKFLTHEWYADFQRRIKFPYDESPRDKPQVAIHIRRGDVKLCNHWSWHYLPNSYYLSVIEEYLPHYCGNDIGAGCNVTIYSETKSSESFDVFTQMGFHLALSGPLEQVWGGIINADVAVLSISSFSFIPAVLNRNMVIYPPHMTDDMTIMPGWIQVPDSFGDAAEVQKKKLKKNLCKKS